MIILLTYLIESYVWLIKSLICYFMLLIVHTCLYRTIKAYSNRKYKLRKVSSSEAILITGATSGIGLAISKHLYKLGYSIIACYYDSNEPGYAELESLSSSSSSSSINDNNKQMILIKMDVRREDSIRAAHDECSSILIKHKLKLYSIINNAGLGLLQPFAWIERRKLISIIETNLLGSLLVTRQFLSTLIESKGRIINVSSGLAFVPGPTYASYGLTKSALVYFNRCINMELNSNYGIRSIVIAPQNLIKNTNICEENLNNIELAWEKLNDLEKRLYRKEYEKQKFKLKQLDLASKNLYKQNIVINNKQHSLNNRKESSSSSFVINLRNFVHSIRGVNQAKTLEESGLIECFEDALRFNNPDEIMFAGDTIFNYLFGSILLSIPSSLNHLLGSSISNSLYK